MLFKIIWLFPIIFITRESIALYSPGTNVIDLTDINFDDLVINSEEMRVVQFFAPWCGHCQQFVAEYKKLATALKGLVKVGALNVDKFKSIGKQYGVKGFPTIKVFGSNKDKPDDYKGTRTASAIASVAIAAVKRKVIATLDGKDNDDVITLTDENFDRLVMNDKDNTLWLVEFYAPWCGHCKNLEPHWSKAATNLNGVAGVKLGAIDCTIHTSTASRFDIQGYPTIKWFTNGGKTVSDYDGGRTSSDITSWVRDNIASNVPPPNIIQITGEGEFASGCVQKLLCVVAILPTILDCQASCRNAYLEILRNLGEKYKQKLWGWLWTEGGVQFNLEESLGIGGFGYPAMAVVNTKKMKYSLFRGSFSKDRIDNFLKDLSYGRGNSAPIKHGILPTIVDTQNWNGNDAHMPQDDDFELVDIDLYKDEL